MVWVGVSTLHFTRGQRPNEGHSVTKVSVPMRGLAAVLPRSASPGKGWRRQAVAH